MSNGNQRLRLNKQSNTTTETLVSPVTAESFADYLGLEYSPEDDILLNAHLLSACGWYIANTNNELLTREYNLKLDYYPDSTSLSGLGSVYGNLNSWIDIPLYPVSIVNSVTIDEGVEVFTNDLDSKPPRVFVNNYNKDIVINYSAGYTTKTDIPSNIILGINMMASYLYEHRGACDIGNAAQESGANSVWGYNAMILNL